MTGSGLTRKRGYFPITLLNATFLYQGFEKIVREKVSSQKLNVDDIKSNSSEEGIHISQESTEVPLIQHTLTH